MNKSIYVSVVLAAVAFVPLAAVAQTYTYDSLGRVASVVQPSGAKSVYYYDNDDNRTASQTALSGTITITPPAASPTVLLVNGISNLRTVADNAGYAASTTANYQFVVPVGTTIVGSPGAGRAIDTGTWPAGVTLSLVVMGNVYGGGGTGGNGASYGGVAATAGSIGGDAVYVQAPISIVVNTGGTIASGGGGGGGGATTGFGSTTNGGGGGGGGFPSGFGGPGGLGQNGPNGGPGANGTTAGGGAGGTGSGTPGGAGGDPRSGGGTGNGIPGGSFGGSSGGAGGAGGYAIRKNGNTVTVSGGGTVAGTVG